MGCLRETNKRQGNQQSMERGMLKRKEERKVQQWKFGRKEGKSERKEQGRTGRERESGI